jgi:hypothetical protein
MTMMMMMMMMMVKKNRLNVSSSKMNQNGGGSGNDRDRNVRNDTSQKRQKRIARKTMTVIIRRLIVPFARDRRLIVIVPSDNAIII